MANLPEFIANHPILASLFVAITLMLLWNIYGSAVNGIKQLSPTEVTRMMNHDDALVLDVRISGDFDKAHILSSMNVPEADLDSAQEKLKKHISKPVIACCEHGNVSEKVAKTLKSQGFEQVYTMKGGITAWRSANLPLTKD